MLKTLGRLLSGFAMIITSEKRQTARHMTQNKTDGIKAYLKRDVEGWQQPYCILHIHIAAYCIFILPHIAYSYCALTTYPACAICILLAHCSDI